MMIMKFKVYTACVGVLLITSSFSCKNAENASRSKRNIVILKSLRIQIARGAGGGGAKLVLNVQKEESLKLDSIVYNGRASEVNEIKKDDKSLWVESYFYNEANHFIGKEVVPYKAEGDSCRLHYSLNNSFKSILIYNLEQGQENALWK